MLTALPAKENPTPADFSPAGQGGCGTKFISSAAAHNLLFSVENKIRPTGQIGDALVCCGLPGQSFGRLLFFFILTVFSFNAAK